MFISTIIVLSSHGYTKGCGQSWIHEIMWTVIYARKDADSHGYMKGCEQSRIHERMWIIMDTRTVVNSYWWLKWCGQLRTVMDTRTNVDSHGYTKWCEQSRIHKNVCYDRVQSMVDYPQRNVEYPLMERKSKQQWLTIPQISSKRTTTSHLKSLKTKRKDHDVWRWRSRSFMHVATLCIQLSW